MPSKTDTEQPKAPQKEIIYVQAPYPPYEEEDEINLLDLWNILWQGKWFVILFSFICTSIAVYVTLFVLPETYKSTAVLQPTDSDSSNRLSGLAASLPIPINIPGGSDKSQNIMAFLNSRTLKQRLIKKYNLLPRLYKNMWNPATESWQVETPQEIPTVVKALQSGIMSNILQTNQDQQTGLITVGWVDEDPAFAKEMVENVIEETHYFLENEYETDAQREREFVEKQLAKASKELQYWERQVPTKDLTLSEIKRELVASQAVYTELRKQLELAKITEAKQVIRFKVLDPPFTPEQRFKPKRSMICALTMIASGFFAVFLIFFRQFIVNQQKNK